MTARLTAKQLGADADDGPDNSRTDLGGGDTSLPSIPLLLTTDKATSGFAKWALNIEKNRPKDIGKSFTAMLAEAGLDLDYSGAADGGSDTDEAGDTSQHRPQRETSRPKPLRGEDGRFRSPNDTGYNLLETILR